MSPELIVMLFMVLIAGAWTVGSRVGSMILRLIGQSDSDNG